MSSDELDDLAGDMEMSTKEAAAYLSGPVGVTVNPKMSYGRSATVLPTGAGAS